MLQVPSIIYERSTFIFGTAFLFDVMNAMFELKTSRLDFILLPAFIKGLATTTNWLVKSGAAVVAMGPTGRL
jgi:hypothetical protein